MPADIHWIVEGAVIYQKFDGNHTVEAIHAANQKLLDMLEESERPLVHYLMDVTELSGLPKHVREVVEASRPFFQHPKLGWSVAYGTSNPFFRMVGTLATSILRARFRVVRDKAQAYAFLNEIDETLPPLA